MNSSIKKAKKASNDSCDFPSLLGEAEEYIYMGTVETEVPQLPEKSESCKQTKKVFVGGLPKTITRSSLRAYFSEYGELTNY